MYMYLLVITFDNKRNLADNPDKMCGDNEIQSWCKEVSDAGVEVKSSKSVYSYYEHGILMSCLYHELVATVPGLFHVK